MTTEQKATLEKQMSSTFERMMYKGGRTDLVQMAKHSMFAYVGMKMTLATLGYEVEEDDENCKVTILG